MVDFAFVAVLFFALIGGFIFFAISFFHYSILVNSTTSALRTLSVDTKGLPSDGLKGILPSTITKYMHDTYQIDDPTIIVKDPLVCKQPDGTCRMQVEVEWATPCFFCIWLSKNGTISVNSEAIIEDPCFYTADTDKCTAAGAC